MRPTRRPSALLAGAVALALLTGCSSADEPTAGAVSPSPSGPGAIELVRAAAATTDRQGSSRYTLTTATEVDGVEVVFAGEGVLDWVADEGETTYAVPAGQINQRLLGRRTMLALPQQPGIFFQLRTADVATTPVGGTIDPTAQLHLLAAVSKATVMGQAEVRGEATTRYRGTYDVARALRGATDPVQQASLKALLGPGATMAEASYDVFLDSDGRLRRLEQTLEVPAAAGGKPQTLKTTLELYEFGVEVTVKGPPGGMIRDGAPILAALRSALPSPKKAPAPPVASAVPSSAPTPEVPAPADAG